MEYINRYGLINAKKEEDVSENCLLFTIEYIILCEILGQDASNFVKNSVGYIKAMRNLETGRFNNIPGITKGNDKYISHDQYTSLCALSAAKGLDFHKEFWKKVKFGTYDNLSEGFNIRKIMHPRDYIYIGYLNDNIFCKLLMPLLCLIIIQSFLSTKKVRPTFWERLKSGFKLETVTIKKTDGQLLSLVRAYGLRKQSKLFNFTWKICLKIAEKTFEEGFKGIFKTYFPLEDHPNHVISRKINNYIIP